MFPEIIYKNGDLVSSVRNIKEYWSNNFIAFAIGCSFSFEEALLNAGLEIEHITNNKVFIYKLSHSMNIIFFSVTKNIFIY